MLLVSLMFVDPCITVQFIQKNPTRCNSVSKCIIPYLYGAQHVSGDTPPINRSLRLHQQPLDCIRGRSSNHTSNNLPRMQTRGCWCSFRLL